MITVIAHSTAATVAGDAVRQLLARHGGATSRPNWSCCSPREAGRCPGELTGEGGEDADEPERFNNR